MYQNLVPRYETTAGRRPPNMTFHKEESMIFILSLHASCQWATFKMKRCSSTLESWNSEEKQSNSLILIPNVGSFNSLCRTECIQALEFGLLKGDMNLKKPQIQDLKKNHNNKLIAAVVAWALPWSWKGSGPGVGREGRMTALSLRIKQRPTGKQTVPVS